MNSSRPELKVDWCSYEAAKYAVMHWHYSKAMPVGKTVRMGIWEGGQFIGAVIFTSGSAGVGNFGRGSGIDTLEVAELARVALSVHECPVTQILRISIEKLRRAQPGLRLLLSYADPEQGHLGVVYQAGNWIYTGVSAPDVAYYDAQGKRWHSRSISESGYKKRLGRLTRCPKPQDMVRMVDLPQKHRYLYPLDKAMRRQIDPMRQPYPKREQADEAK